MLSSRTARQGEGLPRCGRCRIVAPVDPSKERGWGFGPRRSTEAFLAAVAGLSCAYFFQGGGWNQNAHFITAVALVDDGTFIVDRYAQSSGDLARAPGGLVSVKPPLTAWLAAPAYALSRGLTIAVKNPGDQVILRAYLTTLLTSGAAFVLLVILAYRLLCRRLPEWEAAVVALAFGLATPIWPTATMLSQHVFVCLVVLAAYGLLEESRLSGQPPSAPRLLATGFLGGLAAAFEHWAPVVLLPLGLYALAQTRSPRRLVGFSVGVGAAALIPILRNILVFGDPFSVGYSHLTTADFADMHSAGFFGFDGFQWTRLYELTLGGSRGAFVLSPFLPAAIVGWVILLRNPSTRPEGLVTLAIAGGVLLMFASYEFWHAGSSLGSRYTQLSVIFASIPVAAIFSRGKPWIVPLMLIGLAFMVMATSVCAIPPQPGPGPNEPVLAWLWSYFADGNLAQWQQAIVVERGIGDGRPTLPFAFNLGQLAGFNGLSSLVPFIGVQAVLAGFLIRHLINRARDARPA